MLSGHLPQLGVASTRPGLPRARLSVLEIPRNVESSGSSQIIAEYCRPPEGQTTWFPAALPRTPITERPTNETSRIGYRGSARRVNHRVLPGRQANAQAMMPRPGPPLRGVRSSAGGRRRRSASQPLRAETASA